MQFLGLIVFLYETVYSATLMGQYDISNLTVSGSNAYTSANSSNFMRLYVQKMIPNSLSNYNSQGMITEQDIDDA